MGYHVWKWEHQRIFHFASKLRILVLFAVCNAYKLFGRQGGVGQSFLWVASALKTIG